MQKLERKWKRSLIYTQQFKTYEKELTWDLFIKTLNEAMEYQFLYKDLSIDIAFHFEGPKKVYELNINGDNKSQFLYFDTVDELVNYKAFEEKSLFDIWDELKN